MKKKINLSAILALLSIITIYSHVSAQNTEMPAKKFSFSLAIDPSFKDYFGMKSVIPPSAIYLEQGIAGVSSLGLAIGADFQENNDFDDVRAGIGVSARLSGYALQIIEKVSDLNINSFGFEPFVAITYGRYYSLLTYDGGDPLTIGLNKAGLNVGTRWYPGNKRGFGILAEFSSLGNTGRGSSFNVGISLGR
ncbi:hypothetical protein GCM10027284_38290 [Cyclobacterium sediminis]